MKLGMIGVGRMGGNMAKRLIHAGHAVVGYDHSHEVTNELASSDGFSPAYSLNEMVKSLATMRFEFGGHAMLKEGEKPK